MQRLSWVLVASTAVLVTAIVISIFVSSAGGGGRGDPPLQRNDPTSTPPSSTAALTWTTIAMPCHSRESQGSGWKGYSAQMCERVIQVEDRL
ncbi:hypothetical protein Tdes44962_MAKER07945 [Teratosphaeria destructans]|uniref:Uncharacterized protein n=1 Tax=Teratosphaeria destructans TaxID=418781 RepID=A0A9W7SY78_9PEZI|nr:hypothetical protein Tdes44962_MAKER07945 [Teratosphaeria destructans]